MALSPKWSEEARKNVKETSIDERMRKRMIQQKERMAADMETQKPQTAAPVASIPSYASVVSKQEAPVVEKPAMTGSADEIYERIMGAVKKEFTKLIEERKLKILP